MQGALPQVEHPLGDRVGAAPVGEVLGLGQVLTLDVQRAGLPPVGQPDLAAAGHVVADVPDGPDRVLQGQVPHHRAGFDHPQHQVGRTDLEQHGRLAHVGVADDHMQPPEPLCVRVRLVPGIDDRPRTGRGGGHAFPDVLGALADAVHRAPGSLQHLACPADNLPGDQERDQDVGQPAELAVPADQVVLVAPVGVAGRVGVVLEQVDVPGDALFPEPPVRVHQQAFQDPLAGLVVDHQVQDVVALGGGVLGVAAHIEVEPGAVAQEHVTAPAPGNHAAEEVPGYLIRGQPTAAAEGAGDPVFVLKPEDSSVHGRSPDPTARPHAPAPGGVGPRTCRGPVLHALCHQPAGHQSTAMYLVSVNSSSPSWPPSRPIPDCLTPPNGAAGSETTPRLMPIIPASRASATRRERRRSWV